jgi:hypothetical protein
MWLLRQTTDGKLVNGAEQALRELSLPKQAMQNFAEHVVLNAARLWTEFSNDQKQRLQKVLFPQGVTFAGGEYGTAKTCLFFNLIPQSELAKTSLATLPGIESCFAVFDKLRKSLRKPHE